ncbi:MAG: hypothetical protein WDZ49_03785, partial [Litorilinea sp.]
ADLEQVRQRLQQSLCDIEGPLGELIRPQIRQIQPYLRAGAVLTTGYCLHALRADTRTPTSVQSSAPAVPAVPADRVLALAAAVEILYIALTLHKRLVQSGVSNTVSNTSSPAAETDETAAGVADASQDRGQDRDDRTFFGSTILAGDYCFSRASQLAAETENPQVVAHFAQTLQTLSEGLLRQEYHAQLGESPPAFDENQTLLFAGVEAALLLHAHTPANHPQILHHAQNFADQIVGSDDRAKAAGYPTNGHEDSLSPACADHWDELYAWWQSPRPT